MRKEAPCELGGFFSLLHPPPEGTGRHVGPAPVPEARRKDGISEVSGGNNFIPAHSLAAEVSNRSANRQGRVEQVAVHRQTERSAAVPQHRLKRLSRGPRLRSSERRRCDAGRRPPTAGSPRDSSAARHCFITKYRYRTGPPFGPVNSNARGSASAPSRCAAIPATNPGDNGTERRAWLLVGPTRSVLRPRRATPPPAGGGAADQRDSASAPRPPPQRSPHTPMTAGSRS